MPDCMHLSNERIYGDRSILRICIVEIGVLEERKKPVKNK